MGKIGDVYYVVGLDASGLPQLAKKEGEKAGGVAGKSFGARMKAQLSGSFKGSKGDILGLVGLGAGLGVATVAVGKLADAVGNGVESLKRIEVINSQTAAAIESTGGAANVTAEQIAGMAGEIEKLTGVEAETVQEGQNLLLTFTGIRNEVGAGNDIFDQTTEAMTDMAVAMAKGDGAAVDMKSTAIQLGKALNDPIKGITALRKVGVAFTAQQVAQIKTLVESGKTLEAQKVILKELNKEFGGSAEAFGETSAGAFAKFGHAVGELEEQLAEALMPVLTDLAEFMTEEGIPALKDFLDGLALLNDALGDIAGTGVGVGDVLGAVIDAMTPGKNATRDLREELEGAKRGLEVMQASADEAKEGLGVLEASAGTAEDAVGDLGDETKETARIVRRSTDGMGESFEEYSARILGIARGVVSTAYQIIDDRAALSAANVESAELAKVIATGKATAEQKRRYQELGEEQANLLLDLRENGVKSGKAVNTAMNQIRERLKTATGQERKALRATLAVLNELANRAVTVRTRLSRLVAMARPLGLASGPQERHQGGPVEAGTPYIVGRTGAEELFVPNVSGYIYPDVPAGMVSGGSGGGGGNNYNVTLLDRMPVSSVRDIGSGLRMLGEMGYLPGSKR